MQELEGGLLQKERGSSTWVRLRERKMDLSIRLFPCAEV